MKELALPLLLLLAAPAARASEDLMMGSVVKSDKWKMDRVNDREIFDGNVSFNNPRYRLKAEHAMYSRKESLWDITGSVYTLRRFEDRSQVEVKCARALYFEAAEDAYLERGAQPVRMVYTGPDGRVLRGRSDKAKAENRKGLIHFEGSFALSTENLDMYSQKGLYNNADSTFLIQESTPLAVGTREGYDFAITAEKIKFFRDSRDIKFYNNVTGWVKDNPAAPGAKP